MAVVDFMTFAVDHACPNCGADAYLEANPQGYIRMRRRCDTTCPTCAGWGMARENDWYIAEDGVTETDCPTCGGRGFVCKEE